MKISLGCDHRGADAVTRLAEKLEGEGHQVRINRCADGPCDYPENAFRVASDVARGEADMGVLVCGTGIGMSIAANKVAGVRAAVVHDELTAQLARSHNDANILCLSGDLLGVPIMERILDAWLGAAFAGGRHARRIHKIEAIERGEEPSAVQE